MKPHESARRRSRSGIRQWNRLRSLGQLAGAPILLARGSIYMNGTTIGRHDAGDAPEESRSVRRPHGHNLGRRFIPTVLR